MTVCRFALRAAVLLPFGAAVFALASGFASGQEKAGKSVLRKSPAGPTEKSTAAESKNALPEGAVTRLGSTKLRHAGAATCLTFSPNAQRLVTAGRAVPATRDLASLGRPTARTKKSVSRALRGIRDDRV